MFSLYKNLIANNYDSFMDKLEEERKLLGMAKLFQIPIIPPILEPEIGNDSIFCPFDILYVEGEVKLAKYDFSKEDISLLSQDEGTKIQSTLLFNYDNSYPKGQRVEELIEGNKPFVKIPEDIDKKDIQKIITAIIFSYQKRLQKRPSRDPNMLYYVVSKQGNLLYYGANRALQIIEEKVDEQKRMELLREESYYIETIHIWILSFLRFINLSNIVIEQESINSHDQEFYRKRIKNNKTHYHILKVKKPSMSKKSNSLPLENKESFIPLHQVRGHLADYTKGNGLFGKYKIRVWIPEHWRGDLEYGKVIKDYEINNKG
jgi:hypothetical protein